MPSFLDTIDQITTGLQGYTNSPQGMSQILAMQGMNTRDQAEIIGQQQQVQDAQYRQEEIAYKRQQREIEQERVARARELMATMEPNDAAKLRELMALDPTAAANFLKMYEQKAPASTIGKIQSDIDAGLIDPVTGAAALKKATTIAPVFDPISQQWIYAGGEGNGFTAPQAAPEAPTTYPVGVKGNPEAERLYRNKIAENSASQAVKEGSEEEKIKRQKASTMKETALGLVNDLLSDPDAVKAITGTFDSKTATVLPSSAEAQNKIKRLRSILTAENLGLMTGVLSETDLKVIADIAGGGLDLNRADEGMMSELLTLQKKFGGGDTNNSSNAAKYQEGMEAEDAQGNVLVYTAKDGWVPK
jgi:hypothetical protein